VTIANKLRDGEFRCGIGFVRGRYELMQDEEVGSWELEIRE
jgi:hypothetical protein